MLYVVIIGSIVFLLAIWLIQLQYGGLGSPDSAFRRLALIN